MVIQVRTESVNGSSEHVVTEEGLRAAGIDTTRYDPREDLKLVLEDAGWSSHEDDEETKRAAARLRKHYDL